MRVAAPYFPVRQTLPDGQMIWRYFGDSNVPRIAEEICNARVYESLPGFEPKEGDTVLDVGAHIGIYGLHIAGDLGKNGMYVAVEADPKNFALLKRNLKLVEGFRTACVNVALWSKPGTIVLHRASSGFGGHSVVFERGGESIEVEAQTLDGLVKRLNLTRVSLIKMDVEGAALDILKGGKETLVGMRPRITCAAYHTPDEARNLTDFLRPLDYVVETRGVRHSYTNEPEKYLFATPQ